MNTEICLIIQQKICILCAVNILYTIEIVVCWYTALWALSAVPLNTTGFRSLRSEDVLTGFCPAVQAKQEMNSASKLRCNTVVNISENWSMFLLWCDSGLSVFYFFTLPYFILIHTSANFLFDNPLNYTWYSWTHFLSKYIHKGFHSRQTHRCFMHTRWEFPCSECKLTLLL